MQKESRPAFNPGYFSGNNNSNNINTNITNNFGIQAPSYVPVTFEEVVIGSGWGASPPEIDRDHLCDEYNLPQGGTGQWIFKEAGYREWRGSSRSKLLWLHGGPGTGKTMLAKCVAAKFLADADPPNGVKLVFHFVPPGLPTDGSSADEDRLSQLSLAKVASDLLYSILQQDGNLFDGCKAELEKQGDKFFTNSSSLWKVLRKAIQDCQTDPVYILIDGVDGLEGSSHEELIRRILGLMEIRTVKIFLSSRDVPYISNNLPHNLQEYTKVNLDTNHFVKADVETFIRRKVNAWGWDVELKERALGALLAKSEGIFLWASLAIGSLSYQCSGPDFTVFLEKPPSKLEDIYRKMLRSLSKRTGSENVLNLVKRVALALRPLTFSELGYILACIEATGASEQWLSHEGASGQNRPRTEREIRMYVQSSLGFLRATSTTVSIVHHTAVEYLFDEEREDDLPVLSRSDIDLIVSWECFQYLHHAFGDPERLPRGDTIRCHNWSRDSSSMRGQQEEKPPKKYPPWEVARKDPQEATVNHGFLRYAAESWFIHARRSIQVSKDNFQNDSTRTWLQHQFFETSDVVRKPWIELCGDSRMEVLTGEQTPLHIAICLGLMPLVKKALRDFPEGANSKKSLHLAARFISGVYKILIAKCKRYLLTDPDQDGNTPLHGAAISGHSSMLKDLVKEVRRDRECSNEVNKKNHSGNTPLHLAIQFDHPEIVNLLVEEGADLTIKNNAQLTASQLGAKLERGERLDILNQNEKKQAKALTEVLKEPPCLGDNPHNLPTIPSNSNTNIEYNDSIQPPSHCATTFEELIADTGWEAWRPEIDLNHLCDEHNLPVGNTGRWIFEDVGYKEWWGSQESKVLWLCGGPGTGKTMLAKLVAAEFLKKLNNSPNNVKLGFHFVLSELPTSMNSTDEDGLSQRILVRVASDLLYSILQQDASLFHACKAELERQRDGLFTKQFVLWEVLGKVIRNCRTGPLYILIDGVDGLKESLCEQLMRRIRELREICTVKIFLSSRDVPHIFNCLLYSHHEFTKINLDTDSVVKEDVEIFIRCRVNAWGWDAELKQRAIDSLIAKSGGIFLWVSLAIENLSNLRPGPDFDEFLREPLLELQDIYRQMLRSISSWSVSCDVMSTIWFVAMALRPLMFCELGYILMWMEENRAREQPWRPRTTGEMQPRTENVIRMYVRSSLGFLRATDTTVSIIHPTAIKYLFDETRNDGLTIFSKRKADLTLGQECFRYLDYVFGDPQIVPRAEFREPSKNPTIQTWREIARQRIYKRLLGNRRGKTRKEPQPSGHTSDTGMQQSTNTFMLVEPSRFRRSDFPIGPVVNGCNISSLEPRMSYKSPGLRSAEA